MSFSLHLSVNKKKSVSFKNLQSALINTHSSKSDYYSTSELPTATEVLREAIKDTSVIIPRSRKVIWVKNYFISFQDPDLLKVWYVDFDSNADFEF